MKNTAKNTLVTLAVLGAVFFIAGKTSIFGQKELKVANRFQNLEKDFNQDSHKIKNSWSDAFQNSAPVKVIQLNQVEKKEEVKVVEQQEVKKAKETGLKLKPSVQMSVATFYSASQKFMSNHVTGELSTDAEGNLQSIVVHIDGEGSIELANIVKNGEGAFKYTDVDGSERNGIIQAVGNSYDVFLADGTLENSRIRFHSASESEYSDAIQASNQVSGEEFTDEQREEMEENLQSYYESGMQNDTHVAQVGFAFGSSTDM
ncbi:MAG: hypothetical protein KBD63_04360 [Bacteriovoracaceae bacterium]|nr:hypothetical protein [Bacteriovoracaceae bacterium]